MWWKELQNDDGTVKSIAEIELITALHGISLVYDQVTSCQTGITGSWLYATYQHAGNKNTALYDGSYAEWSDRIKNHSTLENTEQRFLL